MATAEGRFALNVSELTNYCNKMALGYNPEAEIDVASCEADSNEQGNSIGRMALNVSEHTNKMNLLALERVWGTQEKKAQPSNTIHQLIPR